MVKFFIQAKSEKVKKVLLSRGRGLSMDSPGLTMVSPRLNIFYFRGLFFHI
jgi:hypothetical protein